jgi:phage shock protein A
MGIFTRFRDIVSSNINAMLDKAEDPEKLINLMIREMEDTLVEIKASCAGVMANEKKVQRQREDAQTQTKNWEQRAGLAVNKGRDDLAREALLEKRKYAEMVRILKDELAEAGGLVEQYKEDIRQLEDKLRSAREKQRMLVQRHIHASKKRQAQAGVRRMEGSAAIMKFEEFENRIERIEAEADLVNFGKKPSLESEFEGLAVDDEIEKELQNLKSAFQQPAKTS